MAVVLDSSFLVAYHNRRDVHHPAAAAAMETLATGTWGRALLLEYVLVEVATVLLARRGLRTASTVVESLLESREVEFVPCSDIFGESLQIFRTQSSGRLSFTDAAVVAVARSRAAGLVAAFDTDFAQEEGITVVPS